MLNTHPEPVYALLRQLRDGTENPEYLARWAEWFNDKTGTIEPAQHQPDYELWALHCRDDRLAEYEEFCGGVSLIITERGRLALLLHEQTPEARSGEKCEEKAQEEDVPLEARAIALFLSRNKLTKKQMAQILGCNEKSLAPKRCPKLNAAILAYKAGNPPRGSKTPEGKLEAWDDE